MLLLKIIRVIRVTMRQVRELHSDPEDPFAIPPR
jgi:hypothetical protein